MIESIKKQGNGWLVNGDMSVPNDERNRDCQEVLSWIAEGNTPEPEFTQEELDEQSRLNLIAELEASITPRNLRGAALGDSFAIAKIQQVEDGIAVLRASKS